MTSSNGSITVQSLEQSESGSGNTDTLFLHVDRGNAYIPGASPANLIPPNLSVAALTGDIHLVDNYYAASISLYPSATGELSLVAGGSILGRTGNGFNTAGVVMRDVGERWQPSADIVTLLPLLGSPQPALTAPLHAGDDTPVLIYAGEDFDSGTYSLLKQARVWAGRDILNVIFTGENNAADDVTSIVAGRDILASRLPFLLGGRPQTTRSLFTLYGPGDFVIEAGRNLGPFSTADAASIASFPGTYAGGIFAIGNGANSTSVTKTYLPLAGADITARYGVAGGIDYAAAIATYGDATAAASSGIDFVAGITPQLEQILADLIVKQAKSAGIANPSVTLTLTPTEAADLFAALPTLAINGKLAALAEKAGLSGLTFDLRPSDFLSLLQAQEAMKLTIDRGFLKLLTQISLDYNDPKSAYSGQYKRAYQAIATLFPAALGYTDNSSGGSGATPVLKHTGDLRMARSLVETQTGGDINLLGPGGSAYVGSNSSDNDLAASQQGILTLQGGSVRTYNDGSVLLYQSRVFTEQGGNVEMFSANGDLNAGKGPKSSAAYPPLKLVCDANGYCRVNPAGLVTGAGIGALLSVPGQDPTKSNVVLTAPHGIIDAGAAGIRVSGNLNLVALQVLNAFNVDVGGTAVGVPTFQAPNIGGLTQASSAGSAAIKDSAAAPAQQANEQPSIIIVEVIGYGGGDGTSEPAPYDKDKKNVPQKKSENAPPPYNAAGPVKILGVGQLTDEEKFPLTAEEKRRATASGVNE